MNEPKQAPALLPLHLNAQLVDACHEADGTRRLRYSVALGEGRSPLVAERTFEPGTLEGVAADGGDFGVILLAEVREAVERLLLEMAWRGVEHSERDTLREMGTCPRIGHEERARILEELIAKRGPELTSKIGADWIRIMLASEFRAVYADGERKGAVQTAGESGAAAIDLLAWFRETFTARVVNMPRPGAALVGKALILCERTPSGDLVPFEERRK